MRFGVQRQQTLLVTTELVIWRYATAFIFTNQSEVDFGIAYVHAALLQCLIPDHTLSHCSPVYSSMELGVELMSLEPSSKILRFVISPGGSEPGPDTNAEQISTQHRLVFRATGIMLQLHLHSNICTAPSILSLSIRWKRVVSFTLQLPLYRQGQNP
jgi:hypothetical protein